MTAVRTARPVPRLATLVIGNGYEVHRQRGGDWQKTDNMGISFAYVETFSGRLLALPCALGP